MKKENSITHGNIMKAIFAFFIPLVLSAFVQHLYGIVDGIVIGQSLGDLAFGAVGGSAAKMQSMLTNFFVGVSAGITVFTSQFYGRDDRNAVKKVLYNGTISFFVFGVILSVICLIFSKFYLESMHTPDNMMTYATTYLRTFLIGLIFCVFYNLYSGVFRALGDAKTPLYVLVFCSFLNIGLDLLFVLVFRWGVFGVAFATLTAQGLSAIILACILLKKFKYEKISKTLDLVMIKNIFQLGIPAGLQSMMYSLSNMLVQSTVNGFGDFTVTAWSAYLIIDGTIDVFLSSLSSTAITFVGQNMGAGNIKRMKESVWKLILISYGIIGAVVGAYICLRIPLLSLFTDTKEVLEIAKNFFFIIMPMYIVGIPYNICAQAIRGLGESFKPMMITLVGVVGFRFLWVLAIFPMNPTIYFLGACYPVSSFIMSIVFVIYYRYTVAHMIDKRL